MRENLLDKTLEQLDGEDWGEPNYDSYVVTDCHRLRQVPLRQFTTENLRLMVGQNIGMEYLFPMALERLREDPLAEGDHFPGDLLSAIFRQNEAFWRENPLWYAEIRGIVNCLSEIPEEIAREVEHFQKMKP